MVFYNKEGEPISDLEWSHLLRDWEYKTVLKTNLCKATISTVWLGMNHNFDCGAPLIFETMIFHDGEEYCWRYPSEEKAIEGHWDAVVFFFQKHYDQYEIWLTTISSPNYQPNETDQKILEMMGEFKWKKSN